MQVDYINTSQSYWFLISLILHVLIRCYDFPDKYVYGINLKKGKFKTYFLMFEINQISFPEIVIHETKFLKHMTHSQH